MTDAFAHDQAQHRVRFEWGPAGAEHVRADQAVVVDVLSFTTSLTVAVERGIEVFPHPSQDLEAKKLAFRHGATLALRRFEAIGQAGGRRVSLSPASIAASDGIQRLVLPSPNGSAISARYAASGAAVFGACLRNASAVGDHLANALGGRGTVTVIAAGEQWPDGTLRPAVEDLWGAGAVLRGLAERIGEQHFSPEALVAARAFDAVRRDLADQMRACASGVELAQRGFPADVEIASALDVAIVVPRLVGDCFVAAP